MSVNKEDRVFVAKLLRSVRIGNCGVREALMQYPRDTDDESLIAVYHALIHYEADEDLRRRDALYRECAKVIFNHNTWDNDIKETFKKFYECVGSYIQFFRIVIFIKNNNPTHGKQDYIYYLNDIIIKYIKLNLLSCGKLATNLKKSRVGHKNNSSKQKRNIIQRYQIITKSLEGVECN